MRLDAKGGKMMMIDPSQRTRGCAQLQGRVRGGCAGARSPGAIILRNLDIAQVYGQCGRGSPGQAAGRGHGTTAVPAPNRLNKEPLWQNVLPNGKSFSNCCPAATKVSGRGGAALQRRVGLFRPIQSGRVFTGAKRRLGRQEGRGVKGGRDKFCLKGRGFTPFF